MCAKSALSQPCLQHLIACMCAGIIIIILLYSYVKVSKLGAAGGERSEPASPPACVYT